MLRQRLLFVLMISLVLTAVAALAAGRDRDAIPPDENQLLH